ncbi:uncharacterized protein [Spinacia oleracea]|uniref:Aldehyde oxidase/xanthine dehydrogenase second molybdopterin binding domain-containing protein n=1 Tax=Spinacia oleracea TaxID=3562 RepID=A0ABM3QTY7_SPIOL|nr:uncharacterized protein LOC130462498 [Spinacia oleracea]
MVIVMETAKKALQFSGLDEENSAIGCSNGLKVNFIFSDYSMPEVIGYDLLKKIKNQARIWLGEVLQIRFDEQIDIPDLLADGELISKILNCPPIKPTKINATVQIVASTFSIPLSFVFISETSTYKVPNSSLTAASASSDIYGVAVLDAWANSQPLLLLMAPTAMQSKKAEEADNFRTNLLAGLNFSGRNES